MEVLKINFVKWQFKSRSSKYISSLIYQEVIKVGLTMTNSHF
jgi:hypothetical protein